MKPLPTHDNYHEWYANGPYQNFVMNRAFDQARGVRPVKAKQPAGEYPDPATSNLVLIQNIGPTGVLLSIDNRIASYQANWLPNSFDFRLHDERFKVTVKKAQQGLVIAIDPDPLAHAAGINKQSYLKQIGSLAARGRRNTFLASLLQHLFDEMGKADDPNGLVVDGALSMIGTRPLRLAEAAPVIIPVVALTEREKLVLLDAIEDQVDTDLSVETLAFIVDRPVERCHKLFKEAFEQSPHVFVLKRRITCVCGFSSQQHMTNTFTAKLGVSRGKYRREVRP